MDTYEQIRLESINIGQHDQIAEIFDSISDLISNTDRDSANVTIKKNKAYFSICFFKVPKLRLRKVFDEIYLEIPEHFKDEIIEHQVGAKLMSDRYYRVKLPSKILSKNIKDFILDIYDYCYRKYSDDRFDCCSRYMECSDNKLCCYEGKKFSRACSYNYKLKSGIIYFGKNRNV